jgi:hypothetical protein
VQRAKQENKQGTADPYDQKERMESINARKWQSMDVDIALDQPTSAQG